jgi:ketosteroid isomerase-like protein
MATEENAAVVRRAYEAFNTADMDALIETFDESASWHTPGRGSFSGDRENRDATLAFFGRLGEETGGTFRATLRHLAEDDDGLVVGIQTSTGDRAGDRSETGAEVLAEQEDD